MPLDYDTLVSPTVLDVLRHLGNIAHARMEALGCPMDALDDAQIERSFIQNIEGLVRSTGSTAFPASLTVGDKVSLRFPGLVIEPDGFLYSSTNGTLDSSATAEFVIELPVVD